MVRILIADDHEVVREGLRSALERHVGWQVIAEAADGREAVRKATELKPDVAILDDALPLLNGVDATRAIRAQVPGVEILIFSTHDNDQALYDAFAAGARGWLLKSDAKEALYGAVEALAEQQPFFTASVLRRLLDSYLSTEHVDADPLTHQERLVVQLVAEGQTNKEIARTMSLSVKTVDT